MIPVLLKFSYAEIDYEEFNGDSGADVDVDLLWKKFKVPSQFLH